MFQYEFQAWSYLARSWQTLKYVESDYVFNVEFNSNGLCMCIEKMCQEKMISANIADKMLSTLRQLLHQRAVNAGVFNVAYLFPRDQQGAKSRRKLCLQLAFDNIIEEHNGKLPKVN